MAKQMPAAIERLFQEADRRYTNFGKRDGAKLDKAWIGLGMPSDYRPAVAAGLMAPLHGRETPRVLNWYLFTTAGVKAFRQWKRAQPKSATVPTGPVYQLARAI